MSAHRQASVLQLSDTHFVTGPGGPRASAAALAAVLRAEMVHPRPACVVVTGDVADTGDVEEYAAAREVLSRLSVPVHLLPGNHDDPSAMLEALGPLGWVRAAEREAGRCYYTVAHAGFRLVCCDSSRPGTHAGELGPVQLAWLEEQLAGAGDEPVLVALHHHPFRSGVEAMDAIGLLDREALAAVLSRHRSVQRVLSGHLHRQVVAEVGGVVVTGVGSTLRQIHLDLEEGAPGRYVDEPPSLAWHVLDQGRVVTHYLPVAGAGAPYDPF